LIPKCKLFVGGLCQLAYSDILIRIVKSKFNPLLPKCISCAYAIRKSLAFSSLGGGSFEKSRVVKLSCIVCCLNSNCGLAIWKSTGHFYQTYEKFMCKKTCVSCYSGWEKVKIYLIFCSLLSFQIYSTDHTSSSYGSNPSTPVSSPPPMSGQLLIKFKNVVVSHPGLPGVLCHSIKLRTLPQDTSLRERVEKSCWTSLAWWRRLHNSVDLWQCVIFRSGGLEICQVTTAHRQTIAAWLPAFVYL
jgi:hypothetical protein